MTYAKTQPLALRVPQQNDLAGGLRLKPSSRLAIDQQVDVVSLPDAAEVFDRGVGEGIARCLPREDDAIGRQQMVCGCLFRVRQTDRAGQRVSRKERHTADHYRGEQSRFCQQPEHG